MKREAIPQVMHIDDDGRQTYVDLYLERYGTGTLPSKYEKALERFFKTTDKRVMLHKALHAKRVILMCPETKRIEIVDVASGELVKRLGRFAGISRRIEAGWWKIKDVESGQIDWNQPDKDGLINAVPGSDDSEVLYNGDGPSDVMGNAIKKIAKLYRETWDRDPTIRELRAIANFVINGRVHGGDYKASCPSDETLQRIAGMKFDQDDDGYTDVSCKVRGDGLHSVLKILRHCQYHGGIGHSFSIVSDPDNSEYRMTTGWDGDGSDSIEDLKVNGKKLDQKQFDKEEMKLSSVSTESREDEISRRLAREGKMALSVAHGIIRDNS